MDTDAAATWGALNEVRRLREQTDQDDEWWRDQAGRPAAVAGLILSGAGVLGLALFPAALWLGRPDDPGNWVVLVLFTLLVPGFLLGCGLAVLIGRRSKRRKLAAYEARRTAQDDWRRVLTQLAGRWGGTVESDGVGPACRYLIEHWPDRAPRLAVNPITGDRGDRLTLTAVVRERPVLVQVADLLEPGGDFTPPVLVVLVACPLDPDTARVLPVQTPRGQWLAERGFKVGWTRAGVYGAHPGPATALLTETELDRVLGTLAQLCRDAPAGTPVAAPAPVPGPAGSESEDVAMAFLGALAAGESVAASACADPNLGAGRPEELRPDELLAAVDRLRARPVEWELRGSVIGGSRRIHRFRTTFADRLDGEVAVHLNQRLGRWRVCGYAVGSDLVIGVEHEFPD